MKTPLLSLLFLIPLFVLGQYRGDEAVRAGQLKRWKADSVQEYSRTYRFGISEEECELRIFIDDTIVVVQRSCFVWKQSGFIDTFYTFNKVKIVGNKFYSEESNGEFVILEDRTGWSAGLLLYKPWTYEFNKGGEFGPVFPDDNSVYLVGKYPEASKRILTVSELRRLNLGQLRVMRNEIYARYHYSFRKGGKMDTYFRSQDWYQRHYDHVEQWFTTIELKNIEIIREVEAEKMASSR